MEIELADAVATLRDELVEAAARGVGAGTEFVVGPIELEFTIALTRDAKAKGGFKAWIVSGDVEAAVSRAHTQQVRITLTPRQSGGGDLLVGGDPRLATQPVDTGGHLGR